MTRFLIPALALTALLFVTGCGDKPDHEDADTHGEGPHGGMIADIGDHEAHLEVIVDHGKEAVIAHVLTEENEPMRIKDAPILELEFESGKMTLTGKAVDANADGASEWHFRDPALAGEPEDGEFQIQWNGKTYEVEFDHDHGHDHAHGHDDDHTHGDAHGPHDGEVAPLRNADDAQIGRIELKLHDDKGDLELWISDEDGEGPMDVSVDATIQVTFIDRDGKTVDLAVRNREKNEDEDGTANLRGEKTNYFIFPGDTGADAAWLMGTDFEAKVKVTVSAGGTTWTTDDFKLVPHTHHGDGGHDHD